MSMAHRVNSFYRLKLQADVAAFIFVGWAPFTASNVRVCGRPRLA